MQTVRLPLCSLPRDLGRLIRTVAETGSTNADIAAALAAGEGWREGDWLVADRQVAGKGRQGRAWLDGSGNFTGSTVVQLSPYDPPAHTLSFVTSLAIYEAIVAILPNPSSLRLKWPNDILLQGGKLSGILLERVQDVVVIGVGVNLAQAPHVPDRRTIALAQLMPSPSRNGFAHRLAQGFATELSRWRQFGLEPILGRWKAAAHSPGTTMQVHDPSGECITGTYAGLANDGALLLDLPDGARRGIHAGDVTLPENT